MNRSTKAQTAWVARNPVRAISSQSCGIAACSRQRPTSTTPRVGILWHRTVSEQMCTVKRISFQPMCHVQQSPSITSAGVFSRTPHSCLPRDDSAEPRVSSANQDMLLSVRARFFWQGTRTLKTSCGPKCITTSATGQKYMVVREHHFCTERTKLKFYLTNEAQKPIYLYTCIPRN